MDKEIYRTIIAGGRDFDDYILLQSKCLPIIERLMPNLVKTEDIHPPKTGISVHFCVLSLMAMQK